MKYKRMFQKKYKIWTKEGVNERIGSGIAFTSKRLYKVGVGIGLSLCLITSSVLPVFAEYSEILRLPVEKNPIASGVVREEYRIFTEEGWIVAHVLRAEANKTGLQVIRPETLNTSAVLSSMIRSKEDLVGAVNGDFFDYVSHAPLGRMVEQGEIIQTSIKDAQFSHINIRDNGMVDFTYAPLNVTVTIGGTTHGVDYCNKPYTPGKAIILYDSHYGNKTAGKAVLGEKVEEVTELLVKDGVVSDIRVGEEGFDIPAGSLAQGNYVVHAQGADAVHLRATVTIGDVVKLSVDSLDGIVQSMSGGTQLVVDGKRCDFSQNILGEHPRTAVAVDASGNYLLVAIDGRTGSNRGIRQTELADFLISIGAQDAMILDGGGSTEMIAKNPYSGNREIINYLSDGHERAVYNGLAISSLASPTGELKEVIFSRTNVVGLVGVPIPLEVAAIDTSYHTMALDVNQVQYVLRGLSGRVDVRNGMAYFIPEAVSTGSVEAQFGGTSAYLNVDVREHPVDLRVERTGNAFSFSLLLDDGYEIALPSDMVSVYILDDIAEYDPVRGVVDHLKENTSGYVTFTYYVGDQILSKSFPLSSGEGVVTLEDFEGENSPETIDDYSILIQDNINGGGKVGAFRYGFKNTKSLAMYNAFFEKPIEIVSGTKSLSLDIYGEEQEHLKLYAILASDKGDSVRLPICESVDWRGWKTLELDFPTEESYRLLQIVIKETKKTSENTEGFFYFDNITAKRDMSAAPDYVPRDYSLLKDLADYQLPPGLSYHTMSYRQGKAEKDLLESFEPDSSVSALQEQFMYLEIDNKGGYIRTNRGKEQWNLLQEALRAPKQPVVVKFSSPYIFYDYLEKELFFDRVAESLQPTMLVFPAEQSSISKERGVLIVELSDEDMLKFTTQFDVEVVHE